MQTIIFLISYHLNENVELLKKKSHVSYIYFLKTISIVYGRNTTWILLFDQNLEPC